MKLNERDMRSSVERTRERYDVVVVGAGQAGLAMGYFLARQGRRFVILDGADSIGSAWRARWDSLTLSTRRRGLRPASKAPLPPQMQGLARPRGPAAQSFTARRFRLLCEP
jgi:cation diffusion facilitator CzcD-associated flavoprotein CzcO